MLTRRTPEAAHLRHAEVEQLHPLLAGVVEDPTVGPLGVDFGPLTGFDVVTEAGVDRAFAVAGSSLYGIDLATGTARPLGAVAVPAGAAVIGLAIVPAAESSLP